MIDVSLVTISYSLKSEGKKCYGKPFFRFKEAFDFANDELFKLLEAAIEIDYREVVVDELDRDKNVFKYLVQEYEGLDFIQIVIEPQSISLQMNR